MAVRLRLVTIPREKQANYLVVKLLAEALNLSFSDARSLPALVPLVLPRSFSVDDADRYAVELRRAGAHVETSPAPEEIFPSCAKHPRLLGTTSCAGCGEPLCTICEGAGVVCPNCMARKARQRRNRAIRLSVLLGILVVVLALAFREHRSRTMDWTHSQQIAVVLVVDPQRPPPPAVVAAFSARLAQLAERLHEERQAHAPGAPAPFRFEARGPVESTELPPTPPDDGNLWSAFQYQRALAAFVGSFDEQLGIEPRLFDARIYVRVCEPSDGFSQSVEGVSLLLGSIGIVTVELAESSIDFGLFVVAHELLHTRGASDKYGPDGFAVVPDGLAEPQKQPLYPQTRVELMSRGRPLGPGQEVAPEQLAELSVGPKTASEIGWIQGVTAPSRFGN